MSKSVLTNAGLWLHGTNLSSTLNSIEIEGDTEIHDVTCFAAHQTKELLPGFRGVRLAASGFYESDSEDALFGDWGLQGSVISVAASAVEGAIAFLGQFSIGEFKSVRTVGAPSSFEFGGQPSASSFARGQMLAIRSGISASGQSGVFERSIPAPIQGVSGALHVLACSGQLNVVIEAGETAAMNNAVDIIAFAQADDVTSELLAVSPFGTKTHWRAKWTLTGGSASFAVSCGSN